MDSSKSYGQPPACPYQTVPTQQKGRLTRDVHQSVRRVNKAGAESDDGEALGRELDGPLGGCNNRGRLGHAVCGHFRKAEL